MRLYLFCLLIILSCNRNSETPKEISASVTAIVNGSQWYTDSIYCYLGTSCNPDKLSIIIRKYVNYNGDIVLREEYGFLKIILDSTFAQKMYSGTNSPCLNDSLESSYHTLTDDGDVLGSSYTVSNNADSYFVIEHYNTVTNEISGSFEGTYVKFDGGTGPDIIQVTNGKFHSKILR